MYKKRTKKYICILIAVIICTLSIFSMNVQETEAGNLVLVLDAGHDDIHVGASGNNLKEEQLNLQIALACKKELETYKGVTVHMVRSNGNCPFGGSSIDSVKCNQTRAIFAKHVGADAYISLHNNSSASKAAKGASVYYPTTNYKYQCGVTGAGLASSIMKQLLSIGLEDRGSSVRYSEDNSRYPDGSLADYYGVIKNCKLQGIPAIIVEHAFISNSSDAAQYLNTQAKLEKLGKLDAKGIAEYYGLEKKLDYSKSSVSLTPQKQNTEYLLEAVNVNYADSVKFAVWSMDNGQDDIIWYSAKEETAGTWRASVPIVNHATEGAYAVHTYVNDTIRLDESNFMITGPKASEVTVNEINHQQGTFKINVQGISSDAPIDSVSVAVWKETNPDEVVWVPAVVQKEGTYTAKVSIGQLNYEYGTYQVHTYIKDKNGIVKCVDTRSVTLECPDVLLEVTRGAVSAAYKVWAKEVPYGDGVSEVRFRLRKAVSEEAVTVTPSAVTSEAVVVSTPAVSPEDKLPTVEYKAVKATSDSWTASVYPAELGEPGRYSIEIYGTLAKGKEVFLGATQIVASGEAMETENMGIVNPWCDYKLVRQVLERSSNTYIDYMAYELIKEVTGAMPLEFQIPEYMQEKEIHVFRVTTGDSLQLIQLETMLLEETKKVYVSAIPQGIFVIAAKEERLRGDADLNQLIELRDAQLVLRAALGIDEATIDMKKYCDVNDNGIMDLTDAQLILKHALNIIDVL